MDLVFWLSTLIPGFAVLQVFFPFDVRRGIFATLTWSFVLTVAITTPIVVLAHLMHLTTPTVASIYCTLVILGFVGIIKYTRWSIIRQSLRLGFYPELGVILAMVVVTGFMGGGARWDHQMHSAKILYLRDMGFSLQDPYSPLQVIESKFHVNTLHGIFAVGSWLSGKEPLELWFDSAWLFRLLEFGGLEFLAVTVFRRRWYGVVTMLGALFAIGPNDANSLPMSVAAFCVFPIIMSQILDVLDRPTKSGYVKIALPSLALAAIHVGPWLLTLMCLIPSLIAWTIWRYWKRCSWFDGIISMAALMIGFPFLLFTAIQPNFAMEQQGNLFFDQMVKTINIGSYLAFHILRPTDFPWMLPVSAIGILLLAVRKRTRARDAVFASVFLAVLIYMFNPVVFEILRRPIPFFVIRRAHHIGLVIAYVTLAGGIAWLVRANIRTRLTQLLFAGVVVSFGLAIFLSSVRWYYTAREQENIVLQQARELRETLRPVLSQRELICADPETSLLIPAVHVSSVMSPELGNANPADESLLERHVACSEFLDPQTRTGRRFEIASKYGIGFAVIRSDKSDEMGSIGEVGELVAESRLFSIYRVFH